MVDYPEWTEEDVAKTWEKVLGKKPKKAKSIHSVELEKGKPKIVYAGLTEKDIVQKFGPEMAWEICNTIVRVVKSLRAAHGVPTGKDTRLVQYEIAIKHAIGKDKIPWDAGKFLLGNLDERTVQAILRIKSTDRDKVKVWLL